MGILIRNVINEQINFVGKKEIFGPLTVRQIPRNSFHLCTNN